MSTKPPVNNTYIPTREEIANSSPERKLRLRGLRRAQQQLLREEDIIEGHRLAGHDSCVYEHEGSLARITAVRDGFVHELRLTDDELQQIDAGLYTEHGRPYRL